MSPKTGGQKLEADEGLTVVVPEVMMKSGLPVIGVTKPGAWTHPVTSTLVWQVTPPEGEWKYWVI